MPKYSAEKNSEKSARAYGYELHCSQKDSMNLGHALQGKTIEEAKKYLRDGALGTSAAGEPHFEVEGRRFGHVLDPRSGWPAEGVRSASVVTSEATVADAVSTAFLVGGPTLASSFCAARPGRMALLVLDGKPREILVVGKRDGVAVEPAEGIRLVEAAA